MPRTVRLSQRVLVFSPMEPFTNQLNNKKTKQQRKTGSSTFAGKIVVYARPPGPLPRGEGERHHAAGQFLDSCCSHRFLIICGETYDNPAYCAAQTTANNSPSPGGEGRREGGRFYKFHGRTGVPYFLMGWGLAELA